MTRPISLRPSTSADDPGLRSFLEAAGLPAADVETGRQEYLLAEEDGRLVGTIGLEFVGQDALVRSLAVAPGRRGQGLAGRLDDAALALARSRRIRTLYLLTTTAEAYAARRGYERIPRDEVPPAVLALPQFKALCPSTAVCMRRPLEHRVGHRGRSSAEEQERTVAVAGQDPPGQDEAEVERDGPRPKEGPEPGHDPSAGGRPGDHEGQHRALARAALEE